jgi:hypothetical protein
MTSSHSWSSGFFFNKWRMCRLMMALWCETEGVRAHTYIYTFRMSLRVKKKKTHLYSFSRENEEEGTAGNQLNSSWCWWRPIHERGKGRERKHRRRRGLIIVIVVLLSRCSFFFYIIYFFWYLTTEPLRITIVLMSEGLFLCT